MSHLEITAKLADLEIRSDLESYDSKLIVLPRQGTTTGDTPAPITAPQESAFTASFGALLPSAQYITNSQGKFAYYDLPPTSAATSPNTPQRVLLIHGIQTPALGLHPVATHLRKTFPTVHFILYDLWGHGLSDTPRMPHTRELFLEQVDSLMEHVKWPSAHMAGYSLGSTIVAGYLASKKEGRKEKIQSYVYIAPAGLFNLGTFEGDPEKVKEQAKIIEGGEGEESEWESRRWIVDFLEGGELVVPEGSRERIQKGEVVAEAVKWWEMRYHEGHPASIVSIFREDNVMDREETFKEASATGVRGMAVLGEKDGLNSEVQVRNVGVEDVVVVKGAGHDVVRSQAGTVAEAIARFWKSMGLKGNSRSCDM